MELKLSEETVLTEEKVKRLDLALSIYPPEDVLDYYERCLTSTDHGHLNEKDQDCALAILKILQSLK
jgi:hypothetical protein